MTNPRAAAPTPQSLMIVRVALAMGVLLFGGVIWFLHRSTGRPLARDLTQASIITMAFRLEAALAFLAAMFVRGRLKSTRDFAKRAPLLIAGWALGESAGLFGGVVYLLFGDAASYLVGLFVLLAVFLLLPIDPRPI
jgi:hypothetical protein